MEKPLIFLDIDDTLLNTKDVQRAALNQKYNFSSLEELDSYLDNIELKELFEISTQILNYKNVDAFFQRTPYAYETIRDLVDSVRFECCTARPLCHSSLIDKIIFDYYESCIDKIHYFGELSSKIKYSQEKGAKLLVDDSKGSLKGVKDSGLKGILYTPNLNENPDGIIIMNDWRQFPRILESHLF